MPRKMYYVERYNAYRREWMRVFGSPDQQQAIDSYRAYAALLVQPVPDLYPEGFVRLREKTIGEPWQVVTSA